MKAPLTVVQLSRKLGMSRQNYYKKRKQRERKAADGGLIGQLVRGERALQPRLGGKKLLRLLKPQLAQEGINIGRDRFFGVLREQGLLLEPLPTAPRTTDSRHSLPVFRNLVKDLELDGPNQAWVADITCIRTDEGFLYLSLLMDRWSRKTVGCHAGDTLEAEGALRALNRALASLPAGASPTHHSDRGCQYCSHRYVEKLQARGLAISMTGELHCYENAHAERLNGILKQEYGLGVSLRSKQQALRAIDEAVVLYNTRRPHVALNFETPEHRHRRVA
jgi:transposase InsO family protein